MRHGRTDNNHTEIVQALRAAGGTVLSLADLGRGAPDLLVGYDGRNYLIEIKDGSKPPSHRRLTEDEQEWHAAWAGQIAIAQNVDEALEVISGWRFWWDTSARDKAHQVSGS